MAQKLTVVVTGSTGKQGGAVTCDPHSTQAKAFDGLRETELIPGPKVSAEEIRELARLASASFGHAVGTCKIGVDDLAVVDPQLRVHGILGLRVADASVMSRIITGPGTNASAYMIGGRAAKLIFG